MGKHFNLKKAKKKTADEYYADQYTYWRKKQEEGGKYFILFRDFEDIHLKDISPGALKLFIYYGFKSNNQTGLSWYSVATIAEYFGVSERTINNWNSELEQRGLVSRTKSDNKASKQTWLLPFSTNYVQINSDLEDYTTEAKNTSFVQVYGDICRVYHIFQWRSNKKNFDLKNSSKQVKNVKYNSPWHALVIVTKKEFEGNSGQKIYQLTIHLYELKTYQGESYNYAVGEVNKMFNDLYVFDSNIKLDGYDVHGIAVGGKNNIQDKLILSDLIEELSSPEANIESLEKVELIEYLPTPDLEQGSNDAESEE